jgi:RNA ligase (TIGR02306 family)
MRKLASIQKVWEIAPIENADAIELAKVRGWQVVVRKGEVAAGELCVYFEVDSFLPVEERYEFLRSTSYRKNDFMGEGFRIKTLRLRGQISQGLLIPLKQFPEYADQPVGTDLTEQLQVKKWELPEMETSGGTRAGDFVPWCSKTDETRVQGEPALLEELQGKPYYITTKIDGTSCTITCMEGQVQVCGRNLEYKDDGKCAFWNYVHAQGLDEKLLGLGRNLAIQGEYAGPGIQKNRLKLSRGSLFVFTMVDLDQHLRLGMAETSKLCDELGLTMVPIEETGECFQYSQEELLLKAQGLYPSGQAKEGIVVRPQEPVYSPTLRGPLSFKVLNNRFLLKDV